MAMQAALRRYGEEVRRTHGLEMHMRVGLNSGEVVVRTISNDLHMDYSAVGQTTHLAARMEQLAPPGGIRLTAATLRLVDGLVQAQALGQFPVKGLPEPVEVFELTGASAIHRRLQAVAARGLTRFVSRQHELATLRQALERAAAGHGQIVAIVGEAGVGKSRLVYEFTQADVPRTWLILEAGSVSYGKATIRLLAAAEGIVLDRLTPVYILKQAVMHGVISRDEYHFLTKAMEYRNALVHGFKTIDLDSALVKELISTTRHLLQETLLDASEDRKRS
jgi:hypothetical protein